MAPRITASRTSPADCSRDAPGTATSTAPNSSVPAANVRAVAAFVCARAHRASAPLGRPADPGPSCVPLSRQGGTRGGRLTAGKSGRGEAHSLQRDSPSPAPARRFAAGPCGRWAQYTQNGPPSMASRKHEPPVRCPARGACRLPSPWASLLPRTTRRDAQGWGSRRVVARCRWQVRTRRPPHAFGSCAYSGGGSPFPTSGGPGERERASPHG